MDKRIDKRIIPIEQIIPAPYNPRIMDDAERKKLKRSIATFNCVQLVVWNSRTNHAVGGNQTLSVLKELGYKEVEVAVVDLSLEDEKVLNIGLNKISGRWDENGLAVLLRELSETPGCDTSLTGFEKVEIGQVFDRSLQDILEDAIDLDKEASMIKKAITKKGEKLSLGRSVLSCRDSADPKTIADLMGNEKANMLLTDPPYGCNYIQNQPEKQRPKPSRAWDPIYLDNLSRPEYKEWFRLVLTNIEPYLLQGAPFYIWNGFGQFSHMFTTLENLGFQTSCVIVWVKENFTINFGDYHQGCEFAAYGWKRIKKGRHPWYGGVKQSTVWQIHRDPTAFYEHPTQKPIELFARSIRNSSKRGDIVVDLFAGSGTSILACEALDRRCFAVEHEPKYCDVIVRRFIRHAPDKVSEELRKKYLTMEVACG